jgi:UDP:flavonoid glycosyltransferase YjiC (YdhE family)
MPPRWHGGRAIWRALSGITDGGLERGKRELNETRRRVGLPPLSHVHGGISPDLCVVGTFPQLEYPRVWPSHVHVTGPILWEPPAVDVELPKGDEPLVLVAPSTSQDPDQTLLRAALEGLAGLPIRLLAIAARGKLKDVPSRPNLRLVEWLPYSRTIPLADVVICHGGHGTLAHALAGGAPVVTVPAAGDMSENSTRAQWAGAGLSLPRRFLRPRTLRLIVKRVLDEPAFRERAGELAAWAKQNNGPAAAAVLVERFASTTRSV